MSDDLRRQMIGELIGFDNVQLLKRFV